MNILEVKNLTKVFGEFKAVDSASFALKEGEILGILGPNGAGKTTLIQMLLGVLTPTNGDIFYFDKNLKDYRGEIMEKVNFSSSYTNLPNNLKVKEVIGYTSFFYSDINRKENIEKVKSIFRMGGVWENKISDLSSGQLTRVNLARAFINFPRVLLLDEPTASLDPEIAKYTRDFLLEEKNKFKVSIILTSHNMAEVNEVCDRVIFINNGKIVANNTPENLAKTVTTVRVELLVLDGLKRLENHCQKLKMPCKIKGHHITISMEESEISTFLEKMKAQGIKFDEISIQKPTLEDFFFQQALVNKNNEK
jgi:ABC-2 type transport system ATP-binding protein